MILDLLRLVVLTLFTARLPLAFASAAKQDVALQVDASGELWRAAEGAEEQHGGGSGRLLRKERRFRHGTQMMAYFTAPNRDPRSLRPLMHHDGSTVQPATPAGGSVLFVVYTGAEFYETRVKWIMDSWAAGLPSDALLFVGDRPLQPTSTYQAGEEEDAQSQRSQRSRIIPTSCKEHSHGLGACCKYGQAVIEAQRWLQLHSRFRWVFFVDDDSYVHTRAVEETLAVHRDLSFADAGDEDYGVVFGNFGTSAGECLGGLAAGGGYIANRQAVFALVGENVSGLMEQQMANCVRCGGWADLALSEIFDDRGITRLRLPGLYGWQLEKSCFDLSLQRERGKGEPLIYHYIRTPAQMLVLHELLGDMQGADGSEGSEQPASALEASLDEHQRARLCATYSGGQPGQGRSRTSCAASESPWETPWILDGQPSCNATRSGERDSFQESFG
eukprot:TRINITY_DN75218_c0_g1_i1.p1 TRINITY_DN75218_c0_g1~~TRINITY_DN75218_c0_g1_i1.p1  ORF type:complete len:446 (+),score=107.86 TRINITY_DN75218_c0_g1_i1:111-1448(+)